MKDLKLLFENWRKFLDDKIILESVSERFLANLMNDTNGFQRVALIAPKNKALLISIYKNIKESFEHLKESPNSDTEEFHEIVDEVLKEDMKNIEKEEIDKIISFLDKKINSLSGSSDKKEKAE